MIDGGHSALQGPSQKGKKRKNPHKGAERSLSLAHERLALLAVWFAVTIAIMHTRRARRIDGAIAMLDIELNIIQSEFAEEITDRSAVLVILIPLVRFSTLGILLTPFAGGALRCPIANLSCTRLGHFDKTFSIALSLIS